MGARRVIIRQGPSEKNIDGSRGHSGTPNTITFIPAPRVSWSINRNLTPHSLFGLNKSRFTILSSYILIDTLTSSNKLLHSHIFQL